MPIFPSAPIKLLMLCVLPAHMETNELITIEHQLTDFFMNCNNTKIETH